TEASASRYSSTAECRAGGTFAPCRYRAHTSRASCRRRYSEYDKQLKIRTGIGLEPIMILGPPLPPSRVLAHTFERQRINEYYAENTFAWRWCVCVLLLNGTYQVRR